MRERVRPKGVSCSAAQTLVYTRTASHARTNELVAALTRIPGVKQAFGGPRFHEAVLQLDRPVAAVLKALAAQGILGGVDLSGDYPELGAALLVCATETKTGGDIAQYANALSQFVRSAQVA